jgi:hypothetical protein
MTKYLYFIVIPVNEMIFDFVRPMSPHFTLEGCEIRSPIACYSNYKQARRDAGELKNKGARVIKVRATAILSFI